MHWILGIALAAAVFFTLKHWALLTPEKKKATTWKAVLVVGGALLLFMVLTGRVHLITAAVAALIPLLRKLPALLKLAPMFRRHQPFNGSGDDSAEGRSRATGDTSQQQAATAHGNMTEPEACDVLGIQRDCSREDIIAAHRRLIQKLHPDRGGNNYLAAKINEAKSVLLRKYKS